MSSAGVKKSRKVSPEKAKETETKLLQAMQKVEDAKKKLKELENSEATASGAEAKQAKSELETLQNDIEMLEAEAAEEENDGGPDGDLFKITEAIRDGLSLGDPPETFDPTTGVELRDTQAVVCYKNGFGKPAIVVDCEIKSSPIFRIRRDVLIQDSCPNLMKWRRAGKVKDPKTEKKWSVDDIHSIQEIAIEVPPGYDGNPEDLVNLIPALSGQQKDELKKQGRRIPKQPDVQLLIQWKDGFIAEGEDKSRVLSWESRSGCRMLWKKQGVADLFLARVARQRELNYRNAGGKHSLEERMPTPEIPSAGSTPENSPPPDDESPNGKLPDGKPSNDKPGKDSPGGDNFNEYAAGLKIFKRKFYALGNISSDHELTPPEMGAMIDAYDAYLEKQKDKQTVQ